MPASSLTKKDCPRGSLPLCWHLYSCAKLWLAIPCRASPICPPVASRWPIQLLTSSATGSLPRFFLYDAIINCSFNLSTVFPGIPPGVSTAVLTSVAPDGVDTSRVIWYCSCCSAMTPLPM